MARGSCIQKTAALAEAGTHSDLAAHALDCFAHDGEADASAFKRGRRVKSFEQAEYSPDVLGRGVRPVGTNLTAIKSRFATHCMMEGSCPITGGSG